MTRILLTVLTEIISLALIYGVALALFVTAREIL